MPTARLFCALLASAFALAAEQLAVTVLATTDLHGNIFPYDYYTGRQAPRGLAKAATLIRAERERNPNSVLIDCGDTIQGSPIEYLYQRFVSSGRLPLGLRFPGEPWREEPTILAMNAIGYEALVVGNHDFNYGLKNLDHARSQSRFPWLSANITTEPGSTRPPFEPYIVKDVGGVRVAIIGLTTTNIPLWDPPEHYRGYRFTPIWTTAADVVKSVRARVKPDIVVLAVHDGIEKDSQIQIPKGVDLIVYGHSHMQAEGYTMGSTLLVQPKNWAASVAKIDFVIERRGRTNRIVDRRSRLIAVQKDTAVAGDIARLGEPYHEMAEKYLNTPVTQAVTDMSGARGRIEDTPLVDAIQTVQLAYAKADVSLTALFNPRIRVRKGPVTVRQLAALYIYDNQLYAIEGTGRMLRDALEVSALYFRSCETPACSSGPLIGKSVHGFNFDMAQGVTYQIDLREPAGHRIKNLRWKGSALKDDQPLRIAINNYRAGGSGGYTMFRGAKVVWQSSEDIRDLMIQYYGGKHPLPAKADGNWRIEPPAARQELLKEVDAETERAAER